MACHRMLVLLLAVLGAAVSVSHPLALPHYSDWSEAVNLGSPVNSPFIETGATLSKRGFESVFLVEPSVRRGRCGRRLQLVGVSQELDDRALGGARVPVDKR